MGLAQVAITMSDFDFVYEHISSYAPTSKIYGNMHLRRNRTQKKVARLRYLHAMRVRPTPEKAIDGMICGPGLLWSYEILPARTRARLLVSIDEADDKERDRIEQQFLKEVLDRIKSEQGGEHPLPTLTPGHLYLRRSEPGMSITHPTCTSAIASKTLDHRFLSQILPWGFRVIVGRE